MKLALKIVAVCLVAMVLITVLSSWLIARREVEQVKELHQADATRVADLIRKSVDLAYSSDGHQGIVQAIRTHTVETGDLRYRWVWFDVSVNDPNHPSDPMDSLEKIMGGNMDSIVATRENSNELHTYYPLDVNAEAGKTRKGAIEVSGSLESAEQESWRTMKTGLTAIAGMAVFCIAVVSWLGIRMIGKPLNQLTDQTRKIGDGIYNPFTRCSCYIRQFIRPNH